MSSLAAAVQAALREAELEVAALEAREIELTETESWARDPIGWIEAHVWIASKFAGKRRKVAPARMRLFPDQRRTIEAWIDLDLLAETGELVFRNVVIEKSRQIGETWLFAAVLAWTIIYHSVQGLVMHYRAAEVADRGFSIKSLFGKIRYIVRRLPDDLPGYGRIRFYPFSLDPAKVVNEQNGSTLYGECQRDDPGRGGTFDLELVDEAAFVRHGEAVWAALDEACEEGKALLSTVNGSDNFHARIADDEPEGWVYLRLHWSTHPVYRQGLHVAALAGARSAQPTAEMAANAKACQLCEGNLAGVAWHPRAPRAHRFPGKLCSPWYDRAVIGKTAEQVASELDIDREGSLKARVYDEFQSGTHVHRDGQGREALIAYDPTLPVELGIDYGLDCTAVAVCQDHPLEYRVIGEVELVDRPGETPTPARVVSALLQELRELGVPAVFLTADWTRQIYARGDPAGDARSLDTGRPLASAYRALGFNFQAPPRELTRTVEPSIRAVKGLLLGDPKPVRFSARCQRSIRHMRHNRWETDALGNRRVGATRPRDDEHNHWPRAFAYLAVSKFGKLPSRPAGPDDPWDDEPDDDAGGRVWALLGGRDPLPYDSAA